MFSDIGDNAVTAGESASDGRRLLFFLPSVDYFHGFQPLLTALLSRGHGVRIAFDHRKGGLPEDDRRALDEFGARFAAFGFRELPQRRDLWFVPATATRRRLDYLDRLDVERTSDLPGTDQSGRAAPLFRLILSVPPFRSRAGRGLVRSVLRGLEAGMPIPGSVKAVIAEEAPDAVLVSPLVGPALSQGDDVRAAAALGIPATLVASSWDDRLGDGELRDSPESALVWTDTQMERAVSLYGLPRQRIIRAMSESEGVAAIERASGTTSVSKPPGQVTRFVLWMLLPLIVLLLPLFRPRATARAIVKWIRELPTLPRRLRKRARAKRKEDAERRKAEVAAAKEERLAHLHAAKRDKLAVAESKSQKAGGGTEGSQTLVEFESAADEPAGKRLYMREQGNDAMMQTTTKG